MFAGMFPRLLCVCACVQKYLFFVHKRKTNSKLLHYTDESRNDNSIPYNVMTMTYYDMNMKITFTEHSHISASPYLLHVVVMCPPP